MSSLHNLFLFGSIFLIVISFVNPVHLDIDCKDDTQCGGPGAICQSGICQCDAPYYTPCNTSDCNPKKSFVYEGKECRVDGNCLDNANCNRPENLCRCMTDYTAINGLCYKSLNASCTTSSECWSRGCRENVCQCPLGFIAKDDHKRCQRKLANIHASWADANASGDFCYETDGYSCLISTAICQNDSQHTEKYCQCPVTHTADYAKQKCHLKVYNGLSPSETTLPLEPCGKCQVDYALCANVVNQTTCWCRAGFIKKDGQCVKDRQPFIFPNPNDVSLHNYTSNCSMYENNGLCTCKPGYKFVHKTLDCQPIESEWVNENFEYGVCTRIESRGNPVGEVGLCPAHLNCEAREDKHVCSCGYDRYLDEKANVCYYFLERNLTAPDPNFAPLNSTFDGRKYQCDPPGIFSVSKDNKRCELKLNPIDDGEEKSTCNITNPKGNESCAWLFGGNAKFCREGECRCLFSNSYYENDICVTFIHANPGSKINCPANTQNRTDLCECKVGYIADGKNQTCVPKVNRLNEVITSAQNFTSNLTINDCKALFPNQSVIVANSACECNSTAFFDGTRCVFYLNKPFGNSPGQCPKNALVESGMCKCQTGYKSSDNRTCVEKTMYVYPPNERSGENITNITIADCKALFGPAANISENKNFCQCGNANHTFWNAKNCYYYIETDIGDIDPDSACPPTSKKSGNQCICPPGYEANSSRKECDKKPVSPYLQSIDVDAFQTICNASYTDEDCQELHGRSAVCRENTCYCDRSQSFVRDNRCELFSDIIFPGTHEYHSYTCDIHEDCGQDAEKNGIVCDFLHGDYRVCQCKNDYFFNPINSTCVRNQCHPKCSVNEECENYRCICQIGYYRDSSGECVKFDKSLKLHEKCNRTYWNTARSVHEELECFLDCERVRCVNGYREENWKCVKNSFMDRCVHDEKLCLELSVGSQCDTEENQCVCSPDYYQTKGGRICARAVGLSCVNPIDCGDLGDCLNQTCACKIGATETEASDSRGRTIKTCMKASGVDQIRFNPILFVVFVLVRLFFA